MEPMLVVLAATIRTLYAAQVLTFGCNSSSETTALLRIRADTVAFQKQLFTQLTYGRCSGIGQGAMVEGSWSRETARS